METSHPDHTPPTKQTKSEVVAQWSAVALATSVSLPTFWISLSSVIFFLAWVASGKYTERWKRITKQPVALIGLSLFILALTSIAWTETNTIDALSNTSKYIELLLLPLLISIVDHEKWAKRILYGFMTGASISLLLSYAHWLNLLPEGSLSSMVGPRHHISFSTMTAFSAAAAFWLSKEEPHRRTWWVMFLSAALFNLFFINTGRTGWIIAFAIMGYALLRTATLRNIILVTLATFFSTSLLYTISTSFKTRTDAAISDIIQYQKGESSTSLGLRIEFWKNSLDLIREKPILGHGSGGFQHAYSKLADDIGLQGDHVARNPHNEYLMVATQWGITGLILFIALLAAQWQQSAKNPSYFREIGQSLVIVMAIGCLFNSFLLDHREGHFYIILTAATLFLGRRTSGSPENQKAQPHVA